ncbi:MAG: Asp-tRNA(Asn)/Glu-tRNA(Gln) amidotransferase subunit GatA [Bdellovibrionales bacterium]
MDAAQASLFEISQAVQTGATSAEKVTSEFLKRISSLDPKLNSYITVNPQALEQARALDQRIAKGEKVGRLAGVPIGIKDMLCTRDLRTTAGSKILENFIPPYDATVVSRLKKEGAILLGKLNQDEFAMGSSNETSYFGPTRNPWNPEYVPGGSSGGSAAAQAARLAVATIGTDTGGSIRQPASFCGVVGVKPTYGRVSRYGIIAYASSLDQAGPLANSVQEAALLLELICGHDEHDATTSQRSVPEFSKGLRSDIRGQRVGVLKEALGPGLHPDVEKALSEAEKALKNAGATVVPVSLPLLEYSIPVYYLVATSEASSNLARYDGVRYGFRSNSKEATQSLEDFYATTRGEGFGPEVQRRIMLGTYCLSSGYYEAYYNKACQVRRLIKNQYSEAFQECDVILSPVSATPAFRLGSRIQDPLEMYLNDIFTTSTNLAGLPGLSVPFALSQERLPIGIQLTAPAFEEQKMLNIAWALEKASLAKGEKPHVV